MKSPFFKSLLWALVAAALYISNKPKHKPSNQDKRLKDNAIILTQYTIQFNLCAAILMSAAEILTIYSPSFRSMTSYPTDCDATTIGTAFLSYFTFIMLSFFLRLYSFHALGDLFTFYVTIRPNHVLITGGPYQFVRHPSYTALFGLWTGNALLHFSECNSILVWCIFWPWLIVVSTCALGLASRSKREDELLHETFGGEWEEYRRRVPYRLIPGVF